jgi:hypothetical protein
MVALVDDTPTLAVLEVSHPANLFFPSAVGHIQAGETSLSVASSSSYFVVQEQPSSFLTFIATPAGSQCSGPMCQSTSPCAAGFYKAYDGDISPCLPCPAQHFQPEFGSSSCLPCKSTDYCPVGTIMPLNYTLVSRESHTSYQFPLQAGTPSVQQTMFRNFVEPSAQGGSPSYFVVLISSIGLIVVAGIIFGCLEHRKKASPKFERSPRSMHFRSLTW